MMLRRIELGSALAAWVLGMWTVASLYSALNSASILGLDTQGGLNVMRQEALRHLGIAVVLIAGVAMGGFLHSVFRQRAGFLLLCGCTLGFAAGLLYTALAPGALTVMSPFLALLSSAWFPQSVLTLVLATIAVGAAVTPPGWATAHSERLVGERL